MGWRGKGSDDARPGRPWRRVVLRGAVLGLAWLAVAVPLAATLFLTSQAPTTVASHDAVVRPTVDGHITLRTGPFLPDLRMASDQGVLGVDISLGKTEAGSTEELVQRYAFIASQPDGQVARVEGTVRDLAYDAALGGALLAVVPPLLWVVVGPRRRGELRRRIVTPRGVAVLVPVLAVVLLVGLLLREPWDDPAPMLADETEWFPLGEYLPEIGVPPEAADIEVAGSATTAGTKRLVLSAVDTYQRSRTFYRGVAERAADLELRMPAEGETVALVVSDRHDNIGMDPVARAIADQAGASAVLDAGDDTSTGAAWEAFSLDSLDDAFADYGDSRYVVSGNHDNGDFVDEYLRERGWVTAAREPVEGPGGGLLLGWNDPRSSGLGTWRDQVGLSIPEVAEEIADVACGSEERVNTLLVHDRDMGTEALERGCVDLVVSGHEHVSGGPDPVIGENGETGYAFTNGTTGGAAYAIAVGSKLRRPAEVTLVTYRDGRPVGMQGVMVQTNGVFVTDEYVELDYASGLLPIGTRVDREDRDERAGGPDRRGRD